MNCFDFSKMRADGRRALAAATAYPPRRAVMLHSGVTIGVSLLLFAMGYLLDMGIEQTGGLSGIGTRTVLETVKSVLQTANMLLLPFWSIGYYRMSLQWSRWEQADVRTLFSGFRCFGPVLRLYILQSLLYAVLGIAAGYAGGAVFMLTPGAESLFALTQELVNSGVTDANAIMESEAYMEAVMPMIPYMVVAAAVVILPAAYRLRFAQFALMDNPRMGALRAMIKSWRMTRKRCLPLLKLDLRFWWYHLAMVLITVLCYGDALLPMVGIDLGISAEVAMLGFYIAALLCEFGLHVWRRNEVFTVYALAYDQLGQPQTEVPAPKPERVPWTY